MMHESCVALSSVLSEIPESPKRLSVTPQENHKAGGGTNNTTSHHNYGSTTAHHHH